MYLSSLEPCAAIRIAKELLPNNPFLFAKAVQATLIQSGKKLDEIETYLPILEQFDIDPLQFQEKWLCEENLALTKIKFEGASHMVSGFPALLIEQNGTTKMLASGYFEKETMTKKLEQLK